MDFQIWERERKKSISSKVKFKTELIILSFVSPYNSKEIIKKNSKIKSSHHLFAG